MCGKENQSQHASSLSGGSPQTEETPFEMDYRIQGIFSTTISAPSPLFSTKRDYFWIFYEIPHVREHLISRFFVLNRGWLAHTVS